MTEKPIGILGGTFDPVHCAHLRLAHDACQQLGLGRVLWIPAGNPPHREHPSVSPEQRLAMVALAVRGHDEFAIDDSETRSSAPSYTVATLRRLRKAYAQTPLVLLLGTDAFLGLADWHRWRELFTLAHIAVATRPGYGLDPQQMDDALRTEYLRRHCADPMRLANTPAGSVFPFPIKPLDISASAIRARLAAGEPAQDLLPPAVLDYIAHNHLYQAR